VERLNVEFAFFNVFSNDKAAAGLLDPWSHLVPGTAKFSKHLGE
jgi:hypothetical protein